MMSTDNEHKASIYGLPEGWRMTQLRHLVTCLDGKRVPLNAEQRGERTGTIPYFGANGIVDYINEWLFDDELILLGEDGAPFFIPYRDVAFLIKGKVWVNNHAHVLRPSEKVNTRFLVYALNCTNYRPYVNGSTRDKLTQDEMNRILIPLPICDIQSDIASFLDRETAKLDQLVEKKQRLIELLQEKRQALITQAVSKGLDPNVPMKDSGIPWLGEVQANWDVCKLNVRYSIELGKMLDEKRIGGKFLLRYLRNQDVQWGDINTEDLPEMDIDDSERERYTVTNGDLLVCEGGDIGRAAIWRGNDNEIGFQKALHRVRPRTTGRDTSEFLYFVLFAAKHCGVFDENGNKATISHLTGERFRQYRFAFPPLDVQQKIVEYIARSETQLRTLISKLEKSVVLLGQYRQALISAAVTGQIDVREATITTEEVVTS